MKTETTIIEIHNGRKHLTIFNIEITGQCDKRNLQIEMGNSGILCTTVNLPERKERYKIDVLFQTCQFGTQFIVFALESLGEHRRTFCFSSFPGVADLEMEFGVWLKEWVPAGVLIAGNGLDHQEGAQ